MDKKSFDEWFDSLSEKKQQEYFEDLDTDYLVQQYQLEKY